MGIFSIANQHIRFAVKLACAIVLALFVGFHFQLETPRWAVLTAAGSDAHEGERGVLRFLGAGFEIDVLQQIGRAHV